MKWQKPLLLYILSALAPVGLDTRAVIAQQQPYRAPYRAPSKPAGKSDAKQKRHANDGAALYD